MTKDTTGQLQSLVEQFAAATGVGERNALIEQILFKWTGAENIGPTSRGRNIDAQKLGVLEKVFGESFVGMAGPNPNPEASILLRDSYHAVYEFFYSELMAQTHLKDLYGKLSYTQDETTGKVKADFTSIIPDLVASLNNDRQQGEQLLSEFARTLRGGSFCPHDCYMIFREHMIEIDPELGWIFDTDGLPVIDGSSLGIDQRSHVYGTDNADAIRGSLTEGTGVLIGLRGDDVIYGTDRDETLTNRGGDSLLVGGGGNDTLVAGTGNDILDGGTGDDYLNGEWGNDIYIFRRGSSHDRITETDRTAGNIDTIWIGSNLTPDDIVVRSLNSNDLVFRIVGTDDTMTVTGWVNPNSVCFEQVERVQFADSTIWDVDEIYRRQMLGTEGDDFLIGLPGDDVIDALGGKDTVLGMDGDDTLRGGEGNDRLQGGAGNDTLVGEAGKDTLEGGSGNDTYVFGRGSGQDIIYDFDKTPGNLDTIRLAEDVAPEDITFRRNGDNLELSIDGTTDKITVQNWFWKDSTMYQVEQIQFADGATLDSEAIKLLVLQGTPGDDKLIGYSSSDLIQGLDGNDEIHGYDGGDGLEGGAGNDQLYGEAGDDVLRGGEGNDSLHGDAGNDFLDGGPGTDYLHGNLGNDTYLFGRGSGQDAIYDFDPTPGNLDVIRLADDITPDDIALNRRRDNLELCIIGTPDKMTVGIWFWNDSPENRVERIEFADGTAWDVDTIKSMIGLRGTSGDDTLIGYSTSDTMRGYAGNDTIYGRAGDDILDGGTGDDTLYGEAGNDTLLGGDGRDILKGGSGDDVLDGGTDNDSLSGEAGNDTYRFGRGSGQDTIFDQDATLGNQDTILLNEDLAPTDISLRRVGDNLVLSVNDSVDTLTAWDWFKDESTEWQVEQIKFSDGLVWNADTIKQMSLQGTQGDDIRIGFSGADTIRGFAGDDRLYGRGGDDILDGGTGNDALYGETGNDTYVFGRGSGRDTIIDTDQTPGNLDTILLNEDVASSDVRLTRDGFDLVFSINDTSDQLTVRNWFSEDSTRQSYKGLLATITSWVIRLTIHLEGSVARMHSMAAKAMISWMVEQVMTG